MPAKKTPYYDRTECGFGPIIESRFLDRGLGDAIIDSSKPDGLLFYQNFS